MRGGGPKAVWNFSKNSSVLVRTCFPKFELVHELACPQPTCRWHAGKQQYRLGTVRTSQELALCTRNLLCFGVVSECLIRQLVTGNSSHWKTECSRWKHEGVLEFAITDDTAHNVDKLWSCFMVKLKLKISHQVFFALVLIPLVFCRPSPQVVYSYFFFILSLFIFFP